MKNNQKKIISIAAVVLVALIAVFAVIYFTSKPKTAVGAKEITVSVVLADNTTTKHTINTDEEFLRGALEQEKLVSGSESEYGLFVTTVDGVTADDANQEWWCFTKGGEMLMTGVDTTPIADGDSFEITLTVGYDY